MDLQEQCRLEREIERIIVRFFYYLDERLYENLAALMAADGVWTRQGERLHGPAMVLAALKERPPGLMTRHVISNILIDLPEPTRAEASFYMTVFRRDGELPVDGPAPMELPHVVALCRQKLSQGEQGWRIDALTATPTFRRQAGGP
jgi:SnoaL-like domain